MGSFRRLQAGRVGPVFEMQCGVCLACSAEQIVTLWAGRQERGLRTHFLSECGEPIFQRVCRFEATTPLGRAIPLLNLTRAHLANSAPIADTIRAVMARFCLR